MNLHRESLCHKVAIVIYLLISILGHNVTASEIKISWSGKVVDVVEFKENALPSGISVGDNIVGILRFDRVAYTKSTDFNGNCAGSKYIYSSEFRQSIYIDNWNWVVNGGELSLLSCYSYDLSLNSFSAYSPSDSLYNSSFIKFPNSVGEIGFGFSLTDDNPPLDIFDTSLLEMANFDINEFTIAGGTIAAREFNTNNDIIDGYYISFEISEVRMDNVESTPPVVTGKTPTRDTTPTWHWTSSGGGNGNYRFRLNSDTWSKTSANSFTPPKALPAGRHTLYVQESDIAGNWSLSGRKNIVIDLTPPSAPSVTGKTPTPDTTPTWHWASNGGGNGNYRYRLNADTWIKTRTKSFTPSTMLPVGKHTLFVQESDAAGNWSTSGKYNILIKLP